MGCLGDRFVLVRELGPGGMYNVFLGRDEVLDRPVAVKVVKPDPEDPEVGLRFQREGRAAARLSHPNIVRVYNAGQDELDGNRVSFIVMEYVPCGDFKELMDRCGPLPVTMLSRVGADVAAGLAHAHERGIIHRDVKPRNVLLDDRGSPKLADFGIARALDGTTSHNRAGSYLGTAAYSSPEQLRGERVTPKSDVYSLGAALYHASVGEQPFSGNSIEVANQHIHRLPDPPRERGARIGKGIEAVILDCLAKNPSERPDAVRVRERLLQGSAVGASAALAASATSAGGLPGAPGISRLTGAAKAAGASGGGAFGRRTGSQRPASGPPERTISIPTRTFRAGSRQRTTLAALVIAVLLVLLASAGAWALLGGEDQGGDTQNGNVGRQEQGEAAGPQKEKGEEPANEAGGAARDPSGPSGGAPEAQAQAPPLVEAEQTVYDLYYKMSFNRVDATWALLSPRLQNEIGSPQQWEEQQDIYTFTFMEFTSYPVASAAGGTAEVAFEVRLDHTWGSESLSGTWVCVNEDGVWKLDHLENERTVQV